MELNRRQFLQAGGTAAVWGTAGCDAPHKALWPSTGLPNEAKPPFAPPSGESIDLATHTLNRLTFGARPGQHARILRLGKREENAMDKFIDEQLAPEKSTTIAPSFACKNSRHSPSRRSASFTSSGPTSSARNSPAPR